MLGHFHNSQLVATFAVGFGVLFNFICTFTFISFYLAAPPYNLSASWLGALFVTYLVGSVLTPWIGWAVGRFGRRPFMVGVIALWLVGIALTLAPSLPLIVDVIPGNVAGELVPRRRHLHRQDCSGPPRYRGVVALRRDRPGDVGAVAASVLGTPDGRVDGLAVVAVQEVRSREHLTRQVGVIRHHAGVDDRDRDPSTLRAVSCPCALERNLGERPLLAEARVVCRRRVYRLVDVDADQIAVGGLRLRH
jgi:hypothetical protein